MSSLKVIVMGVGGVGKSAITNRFVMGRWIEKYDPTVEESYLTTIDIDGRALQVEILDTAGQKEYNPLRETFMHTGDGFLLIYSITDDQTLEELRDIREQISRVHPNKRVPVIVVGNKVDRQSTERCVSTEEGQALAEEFGASFLEISAKENFKVKDSFETLIRYILKANPSAGLAGGSGGVFGAGIDNDVSREAEETEKQKQKKAMQAAGKKDGKKDKPDKKDKKEKGGGCLLL